MMNNFFYKLANNNAAGVNHDTNYSYGGLGGALAGLATGVTANTYSGKFLSKNLIKDMQSHEPELRYSSHDIAKQRKRMDTLAKPHGYVRSKTDDNIWVDITGKKRPDIAFDSTDYATFGGPQMQPGDGSGPNRILLGSHRNMRKKNILAHELGHALQSRKIFPYYHAGAGISALGSLSSLALAGLKDEENKDKVEKLQKGVLGASLAAGAIPVAIEADASWRGSKGLATAKTRWGRIKQRANAFRGVPTYATAFWGIPLATYYGGQIGANLFSKKNDD